MSERREAQARRARPRAIEAADDEPGGVDQHPFLFDVGGFRRIGLAVHGMRIPSERTVRMGLDRGCGEPGQAFFG